MPWFKKKSSHGFSQQRHIFHPADPTKLPIPRTPNLGVWKSDTHALLLQIDGLDGAILTMRFSGGIDFYTVGRGFDITKSHDPRKLYAILICGFCVFLFAKFFLENVEGTKTAILMEYGNG